MKCPICESELNTASNGKLKCFHCGFDDIRTEFINDEEMAFWQTYVVKPCKYAYKLNRVLQVEVDTLRKKVTKLNTVGSTSESGAAKNTPPAQPKAQMTEGWNYNDPIAHPNSAECKYYGITSKVYNIKSEMTSSTTARITFVVQKTQDSKGNNSVEQLVIRYRVKDSDGIIVLNKEKYVTGLKIGDASREIIELRGVTAGKHTVDFVSYN